MLVCKTLTQNQDKITINPSTKTVTCKSIIINPELDGLKFDTNTGIIYTDFLIIEDALELGAVSLEYVYDRCKLISANIREPSAWLGGYLVSNEEDTLKDVNTIIASNGSLYFWRLDNEYIDPVIQMSSTPTSQPSGTTMRYYVPYLYLMLHKYCSRIYPSQTLEETALKLLNTIQALINSSNFSSSYTSDFTNIYLLFDASTKEEACENFKKAYVKPTEPVVRIYVEGTALKFKVDASEDTILYRIQDFSYPSNYPTGTDEWNVYTTPVTLPLNSDGLFTQQLLVKTRRTGVDGIWESGGYLESKVVAFPSGQGSLLGDELKINGDSLTVNSENLLCNPN
jgi:hypothetical protein